MGGYYCAADTLYTNWSLTETLSKLVADPNARFKLEGREDATGRLISPRCRAAFNHSSRSFLLDLRYRIGSVLAIVCEQWHANLDSVRRSMRGARDSSKGHLIRDAIKDNNVGFRREEPRKRSVHREMTSTRVDVLVLSFVSVHCHA